MKRKALFIGGTGNISAAITERIAGMPDWELWLVNRGNHAESIPEGVRLIKADINDENELRSKIEGMEFDCVCDFIGFTRKDVERDWRLFSGKTGQYIFISSASAYEKPCRSHIITEDTPLSNPFWQYSRDKMACEEFLMEKYRTESFPVTIVRPTFTYGDTRIPLGVKGSQGSWQVVLRMMEGKRVIVQGDGTSLWTMTHNSDFAEGFIPLMGNAAAVGEAFHITSDETLTWDQIYEALGKAAGVKPVLYHVSSDFLGAVGAEYDIDGSLLGDKCRSVIFDGSKLRKLAPDFKPKVRFEDGIARTVRYFLSHPELQKPDPEFDAWCDRVIDALENAKKQI